MNTNKQDKYTWTKEALRWKLNELIKLITSPSIKWNIFWYVRIFNGIWDFFCNPRTCYSTHKILLQSFSFLHYITTYSAYFNSPNNSARNLFLFEEKSREKPGRWFSTNFNSTPYWTMLRSQYRIQTGSSKLISLLLNFDAIVVVQMKYYWKDRYWKSKFRTDRQNSDAYMILSNKDNTI